MNMNALYQLPWGLDLGGNLFGRQGYARPFYMRISAGQDGALRVLATPNIDDNRYPTLWDFDLRLGKMITITGPLKLNLAAEVFNVMNANTETVRTRQLNSAAFGTLNEILSPRILRVTAGIKF